jgi:hypothetical protein
MIVDKHNSDGSVANAIRTLYKLTFLMAQSFGFECQNSRPAAKRERLNDPLGAKDAPEHPGQIGNLKEYCTRVDPSE